jgi:hypothetical protein
MRKAIAVLLVLVLTAAISIAMINPAQADIQQWTWLPPYVSKVDGSYVVYKDGQTASLLVPVKNDVGVNLMNVSLVYITFDWNQNKTLDLSASPERIESGATEFLTVSFVVSATEAVSSSIQHTYTVSVVYVNATGKIVGTLSRSWDFFGGNNKWKFVVYSTDQVDALDLQTRYNSYLTNYPLSWFINAEARLSAAQAQAEGTMATTDYATRQDYALAKTEYTTALSIYDQAVAKEDEFRTASENAMLNTTLTANAVAMMNGSAALKYGEAAQTEANAALITANATKLQAEAALTNAYGFYFIGLGFAIGWTFIGIGVIIYALRKPKPAA